MSYTYVLLDADGTLFDFERAESHSLEQAFRDLGHTYLPSFLATYKRVNKEMWRRLERGEISSDVMRIERFRMFCDEARAPIDPHAMSERYLEHLSRADFLLDGALELVKTLAGVARLSIITNGLTEVQRGRFSRSPIRAYLSDVVISDEVGIQKPLRGIFDLALEHLGCGDRSTALMVGDSLSSDIAGGINAGIDTCWYNPAGVVIAGELRPTYVVSRLEEIGSIVRG